MSNTYKKVWINSSGGITTYATIGSFPINPADGTQAVALDTDIVYVYNLATATWKPIGGPGVVLGVGTVDTAAASTDGARINGNQIILQSASITKPGLVNNATQSFSGAKTFTSTIAASNLSGTNTGDVTLTNVGSTPNSNGASLAGQALTLQPANTSNPGVLSAADWNSFNSRTTVTQSIVNAIIFG